MTNGRLNQSASAFIMRSKKALIGGAIIESVVLCGFCAGHAQGTPTPAPSLPGAGTYELAPIDTSSGVGPYALAPLDDSDNADPSVLDMPPCPWFLDNNLGGASVGTAVTDITGATSTGVAQRFFPSVTGRLSHVGVWLRNAPGSPLNAPRVTIWLEPINPGSSAIPIGSAPGAIVTGPGWQFVSFNFTPRVWVNNNSWVNAIQNHNYVFEVTTDTAGGALEVRGEAIGTYPFGDTLSFKHPSPRVPQIWNCASLVGPPLVPNTDVRFRTRICPATPPCPTSTPPDMNGDGFNDGRDYGIWYALDPNICFNAVDCNGDGVFDIFDLFCTLSTYVNGPC